MKDNKKEIAISGAQADENSLFAKVAEIIENRKTRAGAYANREITMMFWEIGRHINSTVLGGERAKYGKQILSTLSANLIKHYGKSFQERNIYRMTQFADCFKNEEIVSELATQLSWSHIAELLPLKSQEARLYYAQDAASRRLGVRELRNQISRKAYERRGIANAALSENSTVPFNVFKDPYLLDTLGLKDNYLERDLERAVLEGLESFILEFGRGFSFVERQKRMIVDGDDFKVDLLFYHRILKRLVAIDLKIGKFKPEHKGQMELYLKWLDKHERTEGENAPIGIILCTSADRERVELLELDKAGIAVAEYWTELPPKAEFEKKIKEIMSEAKERLERRRLLPSGENRKQIDYMLDKEEGD